MGRAPCVIDSCKRVVCFWAANDLAGWVDLLFFLFPGWISLFKRKNLKTHIKKLSCWYWCFLIFLGPRWIWRREPPISRIFLTFRWVGSITNQKSVLLVLMCSFFQKHGEISWRWVGLRWKCSLFACKFSNTLSFWTRRCWRHESSIQQWSVIHILQFLCCARFPALRALSTTGSSSMTNLKMGWSYTDATARYNVDHYMLCRWSGPKSIVTVERDLQAQRWDRVQLTCLGNHASMRRSDPLRISETVWEELGLRQAQEVEVYAIKNLNVCRRKGFCASHEWWPLRLDQTIPSEHEWHCVFEKMQKGRVTRWGELFSMHMLTFRHYLQFLSGIPSKLFTYGYFGNII